MTRTRRALLAAAVMLLSGCGRPAGDPPAFKGIDITGADYARALELPDVDGRVRTLAEWKGRVVLVFFGYTQCPDVCPATMAELSEVKRRLGRDGDRLQGVFVSVDPARDTPAVLKAYVAGFDPGFVALRGSPEQTLATAKAFKVHYAATPKDKDGGYTVDHTAGSFLFDPQGRVRLFVRYGSGADALEGDIRRLLAGA